MGHPGAAASEIHRQGGEDPSAALVVREGAALRLLVFFQLPELLFYHSNTNLCSRCVTSAKAAGELAAPPASAEARSGF